MSEPPLPATIPTLLARNRSELGGERAVVTEQASVTHAELDRASRAVAARLVAAGVERSSRVGLLAPNGIDWVEIALAVTRVGATLVPLSTLLRPPELLAQVQAASLTHLISAAAFRGRRYLDDIEEAAPGLMAALRSGHRHAAAPNLRAVWLSDELPTASVEAELVDALGDRVGPADDMVILFTSGSRGLPKGTIHTHGSALRATASGLGARRVERGSVLYIPMPLFWTGGFSGGLVSALLAGATLLTEAEPEPTRTLALLERERVTLFRGWPDQAARLAAHPGFAAADLSTLSDASLPAVLPLERRPAPGARANLFGMTESFGPYAGAALDVDLPPAAHGSCGRPFDGVEVRIVDPDSGAEVVAGEPGEIQLRGSHIMRGICGRPRSAVFTPDGWYPTGDLGRLDSDRYLWFSGRVDDMFKVKGATVYPSEVEAALRSMPGVRQAHVADVPGSEGRPEVGALVVSELALVDLEAALRERLSAFKVPTVWVLTDDPATVPMLATGKVDKRALQRLLRSPRNL